MDGKMDRGIDRRKRNAEMTTNTTPQLPALFARAGFNADASILDRFPEESEALDRGDFFNAIERAMVGHDREAEKAAAIAADGDLKPEARERRIQPLLEAAQREADSAIDNELAKITANIQRAQSDLDGSSRPPAPTSVEAVGHEIRVDAYRRELGTLPAGERVRTIMSSAETGDVVPVLAAERSYLGLVDPAVLAQARMVLGASLNRPAAEAVRVGKEKLALAQRIAAQAKALMAQKSRGLTTPKVS